MSHDDANGVITNYSICYKPTDSSRGLCEFNKTVGNVRGTTLPDLRKATSYVVAVKAATMIGFGPPGASMTRQTNEDSEYCIPFSTIFCLFYHYLLRAMEAVCFVAPRPPLLAEAKPRATTAVEGPQTHWFREVSVNKCFAIVYN